MMLPQESHGHSSREQLLTVSANGVSDFLGKLDKARFWEMPTESQHGGFDGAEWIMEGVRSGTYHIAVRWCPDSYKHSPEDVPFADAARFLFQLAGHKHRGCG